MSYDEHLADRVRDRLRDEPGITEKRMFGALGFLVHGKLACGVTGEGLMVRLPPDEAGAACDEPAVRPMDMAARPMKGWVLVAPGGVTGDDDLDRWVTRGTAFARSLHDG